MDAGIVGSVRERGRIGRAWDRWLGDATLLLGTASAAVLGPWASRETGATRTWLWAGAVLSAVVAAWVKIAQSRREKTVKAQREQRDSEAADAELVSHARDLTAFGSAIKPGIEHLARLASSRKNSRARAEEYAAIRNRVVDAASTMTGGTEQTRAVFFRRDDVNGLPTLVPGEYSGAREPSGRTFRDDPSDPAGQEAWAALRTGKVVTWADVTRHAPRGWVADSQSRAYRTFMMAPVLGPDRQIYGMLNVDALEPDSFGRMDEERVATFAALLGAAAHIVTGEQDAS